MVVKNRHIPTRVEYLLEEARAQLYEVGNAGAALIFLGQIRLEQGEKWYPLYNRLLLEATEAHKDFDIIVDISELICQRNYTGALDLLLQTHWRNPKNPKIDELLRRIPLVELFKELQPHFGDLLSHTDKVVKILAMIARREYNSAFVALMSLKMRRNPIVRNLFEKIPDIVVAKSIA